MFNNTTRVIHKHVTYRHIQIGIIIHIRIYKYVYTYLTRLPNNPYQLLGLRHPATSSMQQFSFLSNQCCQNTLFFYFKLDPCLYVIFL
jgi:hypothetical protein